VVDVAQLVESRIVIPVVVGSSPIIHPIILQYLTHTVFPVVDVAQLVESRIVIPVVVGSSPIIHPIVFQVKPFTAYFQWWM
jgi:hypothetical protein